MKTTITLLMFIWMVVLTGTVFELNRADRKFLTFADMMVDDNLKNVIKSGGKTFLIVDMLPVDIGRPDIPIPIYGPVYMNDSDMEKIGNWKRRMAIMVKEYEQMDFDSRLRMAKVNEWFKKKLAETQERKDKK